MNLTLTFVMILVLPAMSTRWVLQKDTVNHVGTSSLPAYSVLQQGPVAYCVPVIMWCLALLVYAPPVIMFQPAIHSMRINAEHAI